MAMAQNPGTLVPSRFRRWSMNVYPPRNGTCRVRHGRRWMKPGLFSALVQAPHETSWPQCVICVYGNDKVCKRMCIYIYIYTWVIVNVTMKPPVMHGYFIGDQWLLVSGSSTIWPYMTICHYILFPPQTYQRLSLYNAFLIFFRRLTTPTRFVRPWISMNFYPWLFQNLSKLWQTLVNGWLNKP